MKKLMASLLMLVPVLASAQCPPDAVERGLHCLYISPEQLKKDEEMNRQMQELGKLMQQKYYAEVKNKWPDKAKCNGKEPARFDMFDVKDRAVVEQNLTKRGDGNTLVFWTTYDEKTQQHSLYDAKCY